MAQEAEMTGQNTYSRNYKPIVGMAIAGFALAALFCKIDGEAAQGCSLLDTAAWVALEVLHPLILAAWQVLQAYGCDHHRPLECLLQMLVSFWPPMVTMAGAV